jgi:hypothetical protein
VFEHSVALAELFFTSFKLLHCVMPPKRKRDASSTSIPGMHTGIRQREAHAAQALQPSKLASLLMRHRQWGMITAIFAQEIAHAAWQDGADHPDLKRISKIANYGEAPDNASRDFEKLVPVSQLSCVLCSFTSYLKQSFLSTTSMQVTQSMVLPHMLFAQLYARHKPAFLENVLGGSADRISEFWDAVKLSPTSLQHRVRSRADYTTRAIPLTLHGDGVPVAGVGKAWSRSAETYSWSSIIGRGKTLLTNFFIYYFMKQYMVRAGDKATTNEFFTILTWSLYWLERGKHPTHNWKNEAFKPGDQEYDLRGTDLAGGYYAVLYGILGDLEFFAERMLLEKWDHAGNMCFGCRANTSNAGPNALPWTDFSPTPACLNTFSQCRTTWRNARPDRHVLFGRGPFGGAAWGGSCFHDVMHCKHLGSDCYVFGSVLKFMTDHVLTGTPLQNLVDIWRFMQTGVDCVSFSYLTYTMFDNGAKFPCLKGKAAQMRHFGKHLKRAWEHYMDETEIVHRLIKLLLEASIAMETVLTDHREKFVLPHDAYENYVRSTHLYLQYNNALRNEFGTRLALFHITPKMHYLLHIAYSSKHLNPRLSWCYSGEDFVGKFKNLVKSQQVGTPHHKVVAKVARKYVTAMDAEFRSRVMRD